VGEGELLRGVGERGVIGGERGGRGIMRLGWGKTSIYRIYVCTFFFLFEMGGNE
jgi:hypothetical protein